MTELTDRGKHEMGEEHAAQRATLNAIGAAVSSSLDMNEVVSRLLQSTCEALDAAAGSLLLRDPETNELVFAGMLASEAGVLAGLRLAPGVGIAGWVVQHDQPARVEDAHQDPRFYQDIEAVTGVEVRSLLAVPIKRDQAIIGVLEAINKRHGSFSDADLRLLEAVSPIAVVALENARLYEEHKRLVRERQAAQAQLVHSEKMGALGRLAASISHEINNPLQAIQSCLTIVEEMWAEGASPNAAASYIRLAKEEIRRIGAIVAQMSEFYRPARDGFRRTDMHAVLDSVLALCRTQLKHGNVSVSCEWGMLPPIEANPDHLRQVFLNLVLNAIDAMPNGGVLKVRTSLGETRAEGKTEPAVRVDFADTGTGIAPEVAARLFEPFVTTKERGAGLGLSVSYGIVKAHRGQLTVQSEPGAGATFSVVLPMGQ